jgi:hypothetical protein
VSVWVVLGIGCGGGTTTLPPGEPLTAFVVGDVGVYRFDDVDGDHRYESAGERRDFVTHDQLSDSIYHTSGGLVALSPTRVFYTDNHRVNDSLEGVNAIYALRDDDADGLAMSAGERRPWFSGYDAQGVRTPPIWETALGPDGVVYALRQASYELSGPREVIRFVDANADDDVDDRGEATIVATTSSIVYDISIDPEGAVWYIEPGVNGGLYRAAASGGGVGEAVLSVTALNAKGLFVSQDTCIDILDGAPVFNVTDQRNPFGGTLATFRDGEVHVIWQGRATEDLAQTISFTDFEVLPDGSVVALWDSGNNYNGALYRLVGTENFSVRRILDPRVLERNGTDMPRHTYSLAVVLAAAL